MKFKSTLLSLIIIAIIITVSTPSIAFGNSNTRIVSTKSIYESAPFYKAVDNTIYKLNALHPNSTEVKVIGYSVDNNPLTAIKIGKGETEIMIYGAIHGREALTTVLILNQIEEILLSYDNNQSYYGFDPKILNAISIWFLPLTNPDGAEIAMNGTTHIKDKSRLWVIPKGFNTTTWKANLNGVDLNRNYDLGAPRRGKYAGPSEYTGSAPYSEPETKALMKFTREHNFQSVLGYHSRGEIVYYEVPFGHVATPLIRATGYRPDGRDEKSIVPTYDRWYFNEFKRPVFTVEIGNGPAGGPVAYNQYWRIWEQNYAVPMILANEMKKILNPKTIEVKDNTMYAIY